MKKFIYIVTALVLCAALSKAQTPTAKSPGSKTLSSLSAAPIQLTIPEIGKEVKRVALDNGVVLYLYENHRLPLFNVSVMIRCGSIFDAKEKAGLSGLVGSVMRTGGSTTISGDSLNILMEFIGGSLETSVGLESGSANLSVLAKDQKLGLGLLADLLRHPAFPEDKLELAKSDAKNQIKRRNDDPNGIANRYFSNTLYGDHPYGRITDWTTVKAITVADLHDYHTRFFVPNNLMIGISGDFDSNALLDQVKALFGDWPKAAEPQPAYPPVEVTTHPGVYLIPKDINQAYINIGQLGITRDNPDRYAIQLMNYILGGGSFTSRLTSRVRSDEGLAYRTGSQFDVGSRDLGTFNAYCQTKAATAHKAIDIIMEEIRRIHKEGVTADELKEAKDATVNRLVFNFDTPGKIVRNLISLEYDGWPADFYKSYLDNYRKVTLDDIKRVAAQYLTPDKMSFVVVGKPETFDKALDDFGPITSIELTEPNLE